MEQADDCTKDEEMLAEIVTISWDAAANGWTWDVNGNPKGDVKVRAGSFADLTFRLSPNPFDYRFNAAGPFFFGPMGACPTKFATGGEFMVLSCDDRRLVVRDWNENAGSFRYQLNFVDQGGNSVKPLDPIIRNDGGGPTPFGR